MENEKLKAENEELKMRTTDLESSQILLSRRGSMRLLKLVEQQQHQQQYQQYHMQIEGEQENMMNIDSTAPMNFVSFVIYHYMLGVF